MYANNRINAYEMDKMINQFLKDHIPELYYNNNI